MSYGAIRKRMVEQAQPVVNVSACHATGCPGRGTIAIEGGKFCCAAHAFAIADRWPVITHALNENRWLIEFMDEIKGMDRRCEDWRAFALRFWTNQDEDCMPHSEERFIPYENRMRQELTHRCGLNKRPAVRLPRQIKARGNAASFIGEPA
jgi:hypothetical protein